MLFGLFRDRRQVADVSVLIPVYNHEPWVGAAVESALRQTVRPREILCLDDGSSDGSVRAVEALARRHPEVRVRSRPNRGAHQTLNELAGEAAGSVLAILNSDDLFLPTRLERCLPALQQGGAAASASEVQSIGPDGRPVPNPWYDDAVAAWREGGDLDLALARANFLSSTSNLLIHKAIFHELGGFDELRYTHDLELFLRLLAAGRELRVVPERLLAYRLHPRNTISEAKREVWAEVAAVLACHAEAVRALRGEAACARVLAQARPSGAFELVAAALDELRRGPPGVRAGALLRRPGVREALANRPCPR